MMVIATGVIPFLTADHCLDNDYVGKQPLAWKEILRRALVKDTARKHALSFMEVSLGWTFQSPCLVLMKPRKNMNNVNCRPGMTEMLLEAA